MLCLKYVFFVFNFLLFCCGAATAAIGLWTLTDPAVLQNYINLPVEQLFVVSCIATVVGFVLVIIGFIGCCGVLLDNVCFLCLFSTVMIILLILGAVVAVVVFVAMKNETLGNKLREVLVEQLNEKGLFDELQRNLKCCGVQGKEDYLDKGIPQSCKDDLGDYFNEGCWPKIRDTLSEKAHVLAGMTATLAVIGIISTVVSLIILCSVKHAAKAI